MMRLTMFLNIKLIVLLSTKPRRLCCLMTNFDSQILIVVMILVRNIILTTDIILIRNRVVIGNKVVIRNRVVGNRVVNKRIGV